MRPAAPARETLDAPLRAAQAYYSEKIRRHGATPLGVDWSCAPTQELRFVQLLKACDFSQPLSLNDLGCGYGALFGFLSRRRRTARLDYLGLDISPAMVEAARRRWARRPEARFEVVELDYRAADYTLASGIFNVKLGCPTAEWEACVGRTMETMGRRSRRGFAVNFLLAHDDAPEVAELYRCTPETWVSWCRSLGLRTQVLNAYGMAEFTLLAHH